MGKTECGEERLRSDRDIGWQAGLAVDGNGQRDLGSRWYGLIEGELNDTRRGVQLGHAARRYVVPADGYSNATRCHGRTKGG